ncbi:glycerophosphodiester phosphodiesterase [Pseudoalteromonas phenolica]|uniref:Glycerophosphodiester phosphodiesterase n=1 Tax=Pseudoalteromonas phenolica TaxID=161398 RepID=A0A0S2JXQ1_9GAMM|nr:glycerophosphodiester phosphodiesterase family protein [Pseudoalteromonas phenolica]ALO40906.1 Glycerophosphodiester phosphodiesterase [Pseudoalteromonas phenolica]MBE0354572.1 glycerophosphoryl diester phosphodiesterase [Pseudoalteromonas phenolica O-BC30]TMO53857.1 glycerophosphodiester phosphodiesterase [Pseudoalteromonas phenolica]
MQIFAHRGASGNYPENTTLAITAALQAQVDGIELDVQSCADDFVIIHDSWLDRTTNGQGRVVDTPFSEINTLDAGDGQKVLNLQQVLELINTQTQINLELKHTFGLDKLVSTLEKNVAEGIIEREQLLISSFDHHQLKWLKQNLPWVKIGALTASIPLNYAYFAENLHAYSVHLDKNFINHEFVADAKQRGLKVMTYTVDKQQEIEEMQRLGVDGIFSNFPCYAKMILSR